MTDDVKIETRNGVMHILFNRPAKKNAISSDMVDEIINALDEADANPDIRVLLLEGAGGNFTAGNDIMNFVAAASGKPQRIKEFLLKLPLVQTPVVAAVSGVAVGIGVTMLFHCDLVYADNTASFSMPFLDLGLVPEAGSTVLAPHRFGMAKASQYLLLGDKFDAQEAWRLGLINEICPSGALSDTARKAAERLAAKPAEALRTTRRMLRGDPAHLVDVIKKELESLDAAMVSPEARQAFQAFLQKKKTAKE